jgi:hypothetical protein
MCTSDRLHELAREAVRVLLPLAAFALLLELIDTADWNRGQTRAAGFALAGCAVFVLRGAQFPALPARAWPYFALASAAVVVHVVLMWPMIANPQNTPIDVGRTTQSAVVVLAQHASIYSSPVDNQYGPGEGLSFFGGYKYGPVVPRFYMPFIRRFGPTPGIYLGNALLLLGIACVVAALAWRASASPTRARATALAAVLAALLPSVLWNEFFFAGTNDGLPTLLALLAVLGCAWDRFALAGLALGLSLACKPLPALLLVPLMPWPRAWRQLTLGMGFGLAALLPDLWHTPRELIANLLLFNLSRPTDSTSFVHFLPAWARSYVQLAGFALIGLVSITHQRGQMRDPNRGSATYTRDLVCAVCGVIAAFLTVSKIIHHNYIIWWLPWAAVALAATCYGGQQRVAAETAVAPREPQTPRVLSPRA